MVDRDKLAEWSVSSAEENVTGFCVMLDTGCRSSQIQRLVCVVNFMGIWVPLFGELIKLQHPSGRDVLGIVLKSGTGRDVVVVEGDVSRGHRKESMRWVMCSRLTFVVLGVFMTMYIDCDRVEDVMKAS